MLIDGNRNNLKVKAGETVPTLPLWAIGPLAVVLARAVRRLLRGLEGDRDV